MMSDSANQLNQASQIRIVMQCNRLRESILNWLGSGNVPANMSVKYRKLVFSDIWLANQNGHSMQKVSGADCEIRCTTTSTYYEPYQPINQAIS